MSGAAHSLLLVVEPPRDGDEAVTGAALVGEGARLAARLGAEPRPVTWHAAEYEPEAIADAIADVARHASAEAVVLADTDTGRQLAPMIAERLDSGAIVGCTDVLATEAPTSAGGAGSECRASVPGLAFVKPAYGGWLETEIRAGEDRVPVVALDVSGLESGAALSEGLPASAVLAIASGSAPRVRRLETIPPDPRSVDLVHARRIVAAGSGSRSEHLLDAARELAGLLQGSVGTTRPMVDDGRLPKERLIGQTGRTVTPDLYVALGISGSPHHVAGVRRAERILSVNRDERAPIFRFSDVGYVADLETVLPALVERIKEWRDAGCPDESE